MIGTVDLYYIPNHQFANRQFFIGTKTSFKLASVENVKYNGNLVQEIQLPYSANFEKVNLIGIGGKYYDVISIDSATQNNKSSTVRIAFNPVVSFLSTSSTLTGYWERTPTRLINGVKLAVTDDMLKTSRTVALPNLGTVAGTPTFYYQITCKYDIATNDSSVLNLYGGIVPWQSYYVTNSVDTGWLIRDNFTEIYVPLRQLINDIDTVTQIPSDSIVDVSISARCPWKTSFSSSNSRFAILDGTTQIAPVDLGSVGIIKIIGSGADDTTDKTTASTLTLSDYERYCGRVILTDEMGNDIAEIPTELFDSSNSLTYYCYGSSDFGGLYTHFRYLDTTIVIPEGRLPWIGNAWMDYQVRTMAYDRAELARSIEMVKRQRDIDMMNAVGNGLLTSAVGMMGNPVGATLGLAQMGLGLYTAGLSEQLNISNLYAQQKNKEGLVKAAPSNNYQVGYGLDYCHRSAVVGGMKIKIQTPANITSTEFSNYIAYKGWPCNAYKTFTVSTGFVKGIITNVPVIGSDPAGNGPAIDALRRELAQGVRIVTA